jgi:hypothetical protein
MNNVTGDIARLQSALTELADTLKTGGEVVGG